MPIEIGIVGLDVFPFSMSVFSRIGLTVNIDIYGYGTGYWAGGAAEIGRFVVRN